MPRERFPHLTTAAGGGRVPHREPYPRSVAECLQDGRRYRPAALAALRAFRRSRPWRGTIIERLEKFQHLHAALCAAYGLSTRLRCVDVDRNRCSGSSSYTPIADMITLRGRLSVVTYLHEFGHALGYGEQGACRWSINLFRRMFPRSFARLRASGHTLTQTN